MQTMAQVVSPACITTTPCTCLFSCGCQRLWEEGRLWGSESGADFILSWEHSYSEKRQVERGL